MAVTFSVSGEEQVAIDTARYLSHTLSRPWVSRTVRSVVVVRWSCSQCGGSLVSDNGNVGGRIIEMTCAEIQALVR